MNFYEYEAKIFKRYGLPVPPGALITSANDIMGAVAKLKPPLAVKAQVLVAGRGKAGGILFADSIEALRSAGVKTAEKTSVVAAFFDAHRNC